MQKIFKFNIITGFWLLLTLVIQTNSYAELPKFELIEHQCGVEFKLNLRADQKIYWKKAGTDGLPTKITLVRSTNLADYQIVWPLPIELHNSNITQYYYDKQIILPVIIIAKDKVLPVKLHIELQYAICDGKCYPGKQIFEVTVKPNNCSLLPNDFIVESLNFDKYNAKLTAWIKHDNSNIKRFIIEPIDQIIFRNTKILQQTDKYIILQSDLRKEDYAKINNRPIVFHSNNSTNYKFSQNITTIADKDSIISPFNNLMYIIILAFLGGVVLNFMPCVFPVLSIKIFSIIKNLEQQQNSIRQQRASLILSAAGIIVSFIILAFIVIVLRYNGQQIFIGQNFQQPNFIIFLALMLVIFISSSQDRFNLPLFNQWISKLVGKKFHNNYIESFSSGIIATLLSTPCTGPFLGTVFSATLLSDDLAIILIFLAIGSGFALPYFILSGWPQILQKLPKPGRWLNVIKQSLIMLLVCTLMWLLYVYAVQRDLYNALGVAGILLLIKFTLEIKILSNMVKIFSLLILVIFLFYLPTIDYQITRLHQQNINNIWQPAEFSAIDKLVQDNKIVVIDVTADWCITCKFNKFMVLDQDRTLNLLKKYNIHAMRADFTKQNPEIIDFLKQHNSHGVPYNAVYSKKFPQGLKLPIIYSFKQLQEAIESAQN